MEEETISGEIEKFLTILGGSDKARTVSWHRQKLRTFERFLNGLLFSASPKWVPNLNAGQVPEELLEQFKRCGQPLDMPVRVEVRQPGSDWTIMAGGAEYFVRKETGALNVYSSAHCLPTVITAVKATHIAQFYARLRAWGLSEATMRGYQVSVRAFFGWYYEFR